MDALTIIQAVIGFSFALFIPGYLAALLFFDELKQIEKIALAIGLSIMIDIAIGIFLGYNKTMKNITGGVNAYNVWFYMIVITTGLATAAIIKYYVRKGNKKVHKAQSSA